VNTGGGGCGHANERVACGAGRGAVSVWDPARRSPRPKAGSGSTPRSRPGASALASRESCDPVTRPVSGHVTVMATCHGPAVVGVCR
jgi:hypothetical protein